MTDFMPTSADSKNKCVADGRPVTHQTLRQQGGTGEDSYIYLADRTLSVAAIEKKFFVFFCFLSSYAPRFRRPVSCITGYI